MSFMQEDNLPDIGGATEAARSVSLLRAAEQKRREREKNLFLDVPSWNGDMIAEYEVIEEKELKEMSERQVARVRSGGFSRVDADVELIMRAHVGLWVRDPESGDKVRLMDEDGHVGYGRIAIVLGKEHLISKTSDAVKYLMGERGADDDTWNVNIVAVSMHAQSVSQWMKDPSKRALDLEALLGES